MEFIKNKVIIDTQYKPCLNLSHLDYFNRAMAFAQTNYQVQIDKLAKTQFSKLSPTRFFEEYVWIACCEQSTAQEASDTFLYFSKELYNNYYSFWHLNDPIKINFIFDKLLGHLNELKVKAIIDSATIISKGIKLFGWEYYRNNFLDTSYKLLAFPLVSEYSAKTLSINIGNSSEAINNYRLQYLAKHWNFYDVKELCSAIQKHIPMQLRIIELILWYSNYTFA